MTDEDVSNFYNNNNIWSIWELCLWILVGGLKNSVVVLQLLANGIK